jgi:hypothetical protein
VCQEQLIAALPALLAPTLPTSAGVDDLLVGMARIDRSGRLHERRLLHALGWTPGHPSRLDVVHGRNLAAVSCRHLLQHLADFDGEMRRMPT